VEPADPAAARPPVDLAASGPEAGGPPIELTTVTTDSATFHRGTDVTIVDGLQPACDYRRFGIAYSTLPLPPGRLRCRLATVNDVHFGETEAGRVGVSELGPILRVAAGATPYPEVMNRAAADELGAADTAAPFAAVIVKGDLTSVGAPEEFAAFEDCYGAPFGARLHAVRGNHDCLAGQDEYAGDEWIGLDGVAVAMLDTAVPGFDHGSVDDDQFVRRPAIVAYTAGHTHRHRVQRAGGWVPSIEVGCVKDFPGSWAEYQVYDGGILQIVHRISAPEALAWSEQCRVLYADFGVDYAAYALGRLDDRCLAIPYR
jgi:Icc protein